MTLDFFPSQHTSSKQCLPFTQKESVFTNARVSADTTIANRSCPLHGNVTKTLSPSAVSDTTSPYDAVTSCKHSIDGNLSPDHARNIPNLSPVLRCHRFFLRVPRWNLRHIARKYVQTRETAGPPFFPIHGDSLHLRPHSTRPRNPRSILAQFLLCTPALMKYCVSVPRSSVLNFLYHTLPRSQSPSIPISAPCVRIPLHCSRPQCSYRQGNTL